MLYNCNFFVILQRVCMPCVYYQAVFHYVLKEFISKLLVASPRKRMSAEDMLRESWLRVRMLVWCHR